MEPPGLETIARLTIPADPEYLGICRLAAGALGGGVGLGDAALADLRLLVSEVCAYAMEHVPAGDGALIGLELRLPPGELEMTVHGRGLVFGGERRGGVREAAAAAVIDRLCTRVSFAEGGADGGRLTFAVGRPAG